MSPILSSKKSIASFIENDEMKIIIFSDTHLTHIFDKKKFDYLVSLINMADQVVINGDFWDSYWTTFDKFLKSPWNKLFPILKSKNAIYIFGNHDSRKSCDERTDQFSVKQYDKMILEIPLGKFRIEHGHMITKTYINAFFLTKIFIFGPWRIFERLLYHLFKERAISMLSFYNKALRKWTMKNLTDGQILVAGHTHVPVFDPQYKLINTGFIMDNLASYLVIDNQKADLICQRY